MNAEAKLGDFLLSHGGPFFELQRQLGLLRENALRVGARALLFVGLAWGAPLLISLAEGKAFGPFEARPFLLDLGVYARFLVAIGLFVLMERHVEESLRTMLRQFVRAPIIAPEAMPAAAKAVTTALKQRDSWIAEAVCLAIAAALSFFSFINFASVGISSWAVTLKMDLISPSMAAWWCLFVSSPIFWFLLLRGLWRHFVWSMLLRRLAALKLRLVSTHPDGRGGLAFIGLYPNAYATFVLGISCVLGAALANEFLSGGLAINNYAMVMGGWLFVILLLFVFPLSAFYRPLSDLKRETLHAMGAQATRFHRAAERKILGHNVAAPEETGEGSEQDVPDPTKQYDATRKLSAYLVSRSALVPVSLAALLPLAAAGFAELPYKELLAIVKRFLLL